MQAIKCELCGSNQLIKKDGYYQCEYCGTKYTPEEAKKMIVSGNVEITKGKAEKERFFNNANTYLKIGEYGNAVNAFCQLASYFPDDYRGWWGIFFTPIEEYLNTGTFSGTNNQCLKNALQLCDDESIINIYLENICSRYGSKLRTAPVCVSYIGSDYHYENKDNNDYKNIFTIDNFTYWLIYKTGDIFNLFPSALQQLVIQMSDMFVSQLRKGILCPIDEPDPPLYYKGQWIDKSWENCNPHRAVKYLTIKFGCIGKIDRTLYPDVFYIGDNDNKVRLVSIAATNGRWAYINMFERYGKNKTLFLMPQEIHQEEINDVFKSLGLCQYCGGAFKGLITKSCSSCLKKKDY